MKSCLVTVEHSISQRIASVLKVSEPPKRFIHIEMVSSKEKASVVIEGKSVCYLFVVYCMCV